MVCVFCWGKVPFSRKPASWGPFTKRRQLSIMQTKTRADRANLAERILGERGGVSGAGFERFG